MSADPSPLFDATPETYVPHALHAADRTWRESNCYADLWIAALQGLGLEVHASLSYTLDVRFEGDQFTFYKPSLTELHELYGIRVEEMCLWRSVLDHCETHVARRNLPLVEVDAFYLPDTQATDYQKNHVKTTIGMVAVDREERVLRYLHNAGLYALHGDDFDGLFEKAGRPGSSVLPPYAEFANFDELVRRDDESLRRIAWTHARKRVARASAQNPLRAYAESVDTQLADCIAAGGETYHRYVFASLRQLGSGADFAAHLLRWLSGPEGGLDEAVDGFSAISETCKMLILKTARMAHRGRPTSVQETVQQMADHWDSAMRRLRQES